MINTLEKYKAIILDYDVIKREKGKGKIFSKKREKRKTGNHVR
jgi:hypothetical protein